MPLICRRWMMFNWIIPPCSVGGRVFSNHLAACNLMDMVRSILLFLAAAVAEIGGAWLVWQGVREHRGWVWIGAGMIALGLYGFVATLQPDANFGRILAAYGGVFVAGSLAWGMVLDGFKPDRWDILGALICLVGVGVIMYAPRVGQP
jgi:small multidrug resistance family-3 protein